MYRDRSDAGRQLAELLAKYRGQDVIVLALPRGGVEVGYEIAVALDAELDVLVVRKLGAPYNSEFGFGAIASHGARYLDERTVAMLNLSPEAIRRIEQLELAELTRREKIYRKALPSPNIKGRTVILVDDGIATGGTAMAAIQAVRSLEPAKIVLAIPVAPPDTAEMLKEFVDEFICPQTPAGFAAVGQFYQQFYQTEDKVVIELLEKSRRKK